MNKFAAAFLLCSLALGLTSRALADRNVVSPGNVSPGATQQALDELDEQTRRAKWKYEQDMLDQSNQVQQALDFKRMQQLQLQRMLAVRQAGAVTTSANLPAEDIAELVHRVDPGLAVTATTNRGVIHYKIALKDYAQRNEIYNAFSGVQTLGMSSMKEPPSVTVSIDMSMLPKPPPPLPAAAPEVLDQIPPLRPLRELPEPVQAPERSLLIPVLASAGFTVCGLAVMVFWLVRRRNGVAQA